MGRICKGSGLTINQSKHVAGETYVVANYDATLRVTMVWVLWDAEDQFFTARRANSNARTICSRIAAPNVEVILPRAERTRR